MYRLPTEKIGYKSGEGDDEQKKKDCGTFPRDGASTDRVLLVIAVRTVRVRRTTVAWVAELCTRTHD